METIKVNMNPNPLDVQTIHASQNDNEAREWGFELHNNGELIDTSDVKEQLFFKAYKGGTEQILPENTSTPTTSPFIGDIKYPQGLLTDQEFLYRQSPTEEDGLAKITDIKGNTLVWNQLAENGNFADTSNWSSTRGTISASNNVLTYEVTSVGDSNSANRIIQGINILANHKYLFIGDFMGSKDGIRIIASRNVSSQYFVGSTVLPTANTWYKVSGIGEPTGDGENLCIRYTNVPTIGEVGDKIYMRNIMLIDLTQMVLDISNPSDFTSLFPLPYYAYNQGTLLSFMGNGIKTVGFNQWDEEWVRGYYNTNTGALVINENTTLASKNHIRIIPNTQYYFTRRCNVFEYDGAGNFINRWTGVCGLYTPSQNTYSIAFHVANYGTSNSFNYNNDICINISDTSKNGTYEPYTSSTLSLPISTYFPSGMQGHVDTYDELTPIGATKRFEKNSLGDLTWTRRTTNIFSANLPSEYDASKDISCFMSNRLPTVFITGYILAEDGYISIYKTTTVTSSTSIYLNMASQSIDTVADLQTWLSNNPTELVYPLTTPTETSFTTASLVTENGEIPLTNEDGVLIGKCTEQLSSESGFFDAKIKLADEDGECYSNKIQLHIERSPQ